MHPSDTTKVGEDGTQEKLSACHGVSWPWLTELVCSEGRLACFYGSDKRIGYLLQIYAVKGPEGSDRTMHGDKRQHSSTPIKNKAKCTLIYFDMAYSRGWMSSHLQIRLIFLDKHNNGWFVGHAHIFFWFKGIEHSMLSTNYSKTREKSPNNICLMKIIHWISDWN